MKILIANSIILLIVPFILNGINNKKSFAEGKDPTYYVLSYSKGLKVFIGIGLIFVFCTTFFMIRQMIKESLLNFITCIIPASILLLMLYAFGEIVIWKITVSGKEITYRNPFGITRYYRFPELEKIVETSHFGNDVIKVYQNGKRVFTIDDNLNMRWFMKSAIDSKVDIISEKNGRKYEGGILYSEGRSLEERVWGGMLFIVSLFALVLLYIEKRGAMISSLLFWLVVLLLCAAFAFQFKKIVLYRGYIKYRSVFRWNTVNISDISLIIRKKKHIYVRGRGNCVFYKITVFGKEQKKLFSFLTDHRHNGESALYNSLEHVVRKVKNI